ncbi:MAG: hypothetical protein ACE1ZM_02970 [Gammaproteobacteria bacterium]
MGDVKSMTQSSTIAITAMIVAILISALWAWFWTHNKQLIDQNTLSYLDRIEALEQQLQQRSSYEQDLLHKYSEVLKVNVSLEKALATSTTKLEYLEENLSTHQMGDWENKYLQEKAGNDQIFESMARQEEEVERLKEIQEALDWDHQRTLESERSNYLEQIGALKLKLATSTKANKKLKKQTSPIIKEVQTTTENQSNYRAARMLSLINNTHGLSSQKKLDILVKVIPTVPEGITTNELTKLISGMNSEDILSLIKNSERHIQKTKNKKSITLLLSKMNTPDADVASKILIN